MAPFYNNLTAGDRYPLLNYVYVAASVYIVFKLYERFRVSDGRRKQPRSVGRHHRLSLWGVRWSSATLTRPEIRLRSGLRNTAACFNKLHRLVARRSS
jgi:hypothetical protein